MKTFVPELAALVLSLVIFNQKGIELDLLTDAITPLSLWTVQTHLLLISNDAKFQISL